MLVRLDSSTITTPTPSTTHPSTGAAPAAAGVGAGTAICCCRQLNQEPQICQDWQVLAVQQCMDVTTALKQAPPEVQLAGFIL
jgi:hypothetical protein